MLKNTSNTNLVVVAHPDDEILGFGGTGAKLVDEGEVVQVVILCGTVNARSFRPSESELLSDIIESNKMLGFEQPIIGDFPNIKLNSVPQIDLVQYIETQILNLNPKRIFTHHCGDLNDDHLQVGKACLTASRLPQRRNSLPSIESVFAMEVLSSTDWGFPGVHASFQPNIFVEIEGFIERKIAALRRYRNVMRPFPHPRSSEAIVGLATVRGAQAGLKYAESFVLLNQIGV